MTNQIRDDLQACMKPNWMEVTTEWKGRGGIRSTITATTEKPVCETRAAGAGAPSCAPAKAPVRESPAMLRRPAIVRVVCCVHVCARKCRVKHSAASDALLETWLLSLFLSKTAHPIFVFS